MRLTDLIRVLPAEVIDKIAAGEVIERPASVVKELLENAVDAGATTLEVHLEDGGLSRLCVSDDGGGMSPGDARLAVVRHATSKLTSAEQLFALSTLGFRGEALSSIAAVSHLCITTRRPGDAVGTRVTLVGGGQAAIEEVGCPIGTTIDVRDLFFNTPARQKFMRSSATEQTHACEAALRVVLGAPARGVVVASGERRLLDVPASASAEERVRIALGGRPTPLFALGFEGALVRVHGYVAPPDVTRRDARGLWLFVNGRFVRDRTLQRAVLDGFRTLLEKGRYPLAVVYVEVEPSLVDINVHPQKLEVRFSDAAPVYRAVTQALTSLLARSPWIYDAAPGAGQQGTPARAAPRWSGTPEAAPREDGVWHLAGSTQLAESAASYSSAPSPTAGAASIAGRRYFGALSSCGQALGTYLICQGEDELVLIDQHAAHERVVFERLRKQAASHEGIARQQLMFPVLLAWTGHDADALHAHADILARLGFEIDLVGPSRFAVRAAPAALGACDVERALVDIVSDLSGREGEASAAAGLDPDVLSRCACHAAVRAGDTLGELEIRALLTALDEVDFSASCPHGRPVYVRLRRVELERLFHR